MGSNTYCIIVSSAKISQSHLSEAREKMGKLFQLTNEQIDKVFSGRPLRFLKNIDYKSAQRYRDAIKKIGMACQIEDTSTKQETPPITLKPSESTLSILEPENEKVTVSYFCPACQLQQENQSKCQHCDFNLDDYRNMMKENRFIEVIGKGYIAERRKEHRRDRNEVRREMIRMGDSSDRRFNVERRRDTGAWA